jgi:hypothetical protein
VCPRFGTCIGDYRNDHCGRCNDHFFSGLSGFRCDCRGGGTISDGDSDEESSDSGPEDDEEDRHEDALVEHVPEAAWEGRLPDLCFESVLAKAKAPLVKQAERSLATTGFEHPKTFQELKTILEQHWDPTPGKWDALTTEAGLPAGAFGFSPADFEELTIDQLQAIPHGCKKLCEMVQRAYT